MVWNGTTDDHYKTAGNAVFSMVGPTRFELVTFCTPSAGGARDAKGDGRRKPVLQGFGRNAAPTAKAEILRVSYKVS